MAAVGAHLTLNPVRPPAANPRLAQVPRARVAESNPSTVGGPLGLWDVLEKVLQKLNAHPDLIPIDEFDLEGPLMVVGRETFLASGSPDLVALSRSGDVVLVEFKTGPQNPDFRAALGQLLDYGSDLWKMTYERFEGVVALRYFASDHCPADGLTKHAKSISDAAARIAKRQRPLRPRPHLQSRVRCQAIRDPRRGLTPRLGQRSLPARCAVALPLHSTPRSRNSDLMA